MPWKFILFIICIVVVVLFIGFNIDNKCNISLGVYTFSDVPIFMSIFLSFALGVFVMVPFLFGRKPRKDRKEKNVNIKPKKNATVNSESNSEPLAKSQDSLNKIEKK